MYNSETLTFKGKLSDLKNHNFNINVITNIELIDYQPEEIKIYSLEKDNYGLDLIDNFPFQDEIISIETETEKIRVKLSSKTQTHNYVLGKISQLEIKKSQKITSSKKSANDLIITYVLDEIGFTHNNLQWFWSEVTGNLKQLSAISQEYIFEFKNLDLKCIYSPDVYTFLTNEKDAYVIKPTNTIKFFISENEGIEEDKIITLTNNQIQLLFNFIKLFDNSEVDFIKIGYSYQKEEELIKYDFWNNTRKFEKNTRHFSEKKYFEVIDKMIKTTNDKDDNIRHKIFVAINRFTKASEQEDLSLKIALYHVTFMHLLNILTGKEYLSISKTNEIKKIFNKIGVEYDSHILQEIVFFNKYRNDVFKGINSDFKYDDLFFSVLDTSIYYSGKLFSKIFELNQNEEKIFLDSIKINHIKQYSDYEEI